MSCFLAPRVTWIWYKSAIDNKSSLRQILNWCTEGSIANLSNSNLEAISNSLRLKMKTTRQTNKHKANFISFLGLIHATIQFQLVLEKTLRRAPNFCYLVTERARFLLKLEQTTYNYKPWGAHRGYYQYLWFDYIKKTVYMRYLNRTGDISFFALREIAWYYK